MSRSPSIGTWAIAFLLTGCFATNDPAMHQPEPLASDEFCNDFSELFCASINCGDCAPGADPEEFRARCEVSFNNYCAQVYGPLLVDDRTGYDPEAMAVQLATGRLLLEACDASFWDWAEAGDGLLSGFAGTVAEGGSCDADFPELNRLDTPRFYSCLGSNACIETPAGARCQRPLQSGEACLGGQCATGLTCVGHGVGEDGARVLGVCGTERAAVGAPCDEGSDCESGRCQIARGDGRCLSLSDGYCSLVRGCDPTVFFYGSDDSGPIVEGGMCEQVVGCLSADQAEELRSFDFSCRPVVPPPPDGLPDNRSDTDVFCEGRELVCGGPVGRLGGPILFALCNVSTSLPQPLFYCGP